jgi:hypothetical protein
MKSRSRVPYGMYAYDLTSSRNQVTDLLQVDLCARHGLLMGIRTVGNVRCMRSQTHFAISIVRSSWRFVEVHNFLFSSNHELPIQCMPTCYLPLPFVPSIDTSVAIGRQVKSNQDSYDATGDVSCRVRQSGFDLDKSSGVKLPFR